MTSDARAWICLVGPVGDVMPSGGDTSLMSSDAKPDYSSRIGTDAIAFSIIWGGSMTRRRLVKA
jgi:hypothetical protein